ncbi:hypothetical protein N7456_009981 [Penicillium angulare]|uniref:Uncharacterized protein n=1 Tax=Penicillium angulare TaxID=116970 RepID=A0A9W9F5W7_9EURO|nr:hypothetical protein N7456_009981 [Penicillium angulare]
MTWDSSCLLLFYREENDILKLQNFPGLPIHVSSKVLLQGDGDIPSHLAKAVLRDLKQRDEHFRGYWKQSDSWYRVIIRKHTWTDYVYCNTAHATWERAISEQTTLRTTDIPAIKVERRT